MDVLDTSLGGSQQAFPKTVWEMVSRLKDPRPEVRRSGLEDLCRRYWKPVYHSLRVGWTKSNEEAKDATQAFFLWLLEEEAIRGYSTERASFRTYLKSLLRH